MSLSGKVPLLPVAAGPTIRYDSSSIQEEEGADGVP